MSDTQLINEIASKVRVIQNLPEAGGIIRDEARIADEAMRVESDRHHQALTLILERLNLEAWKAVDKSWTADELRKAAI